MAQSLVSSLLSQVAELALDEFLKHPGKYVEIFEHHLKSLVEFVGKELWPDMEAIRVYDVKHGSQHRFYCKKLDEMCQEVNVYFDTVERLFSVYNEDRKRRIISELKYRVDEDSNIHFDVGDLSLFPETVDFLNDLGRRLEGILESLNRIEGLYQELHSGTTEASGRSQDEEKQARESKSRAWLYTAALGGLALAAGGLALAVGGPVTARVVTTAVAAVGAVASGGGAYHQYNAGKAHSAKEKESRKAKEDFDSLNKATHSLRSATRTSECRIITLNEEKNVIERPQPLASSLVGPIEYLFSVLSSGVNFDHEREDFRSLVHVAN
jgi:hypothetical protein